MNQNNEEILRVLHEFKRLYEAKQFVMVRGLKTVELLNATMCFNTKDDGIITLPNFSTKPEYVKAELDWYESASTKADFISNFASLWSNISDDRNFVNSNYGYLIYSPQNCNQYANVVAELKRDSQSRRAIMVYCPNHIHYTGGNDYVCTMYVSYTERAGQLHAFVSMRSSDLRFGVVGADLAWQIFVLKQLAKELNMEPGYVHWHAVSLHLYERHFSVLENLK